MEFMYKFSKMPSLERQAVLREIGVGGFLDYCTQAKRELRAMERLKDQKMLWLTVNPKDSVSHEDLLSKIRKFNSKKWVSHSWYSLEQRGTSEKDRGKGVHCHILVEMDSKIPKKPECEIRRETYNTFKGLVGARKAVDIRLVPPTWKEDKLEYLRGHKDDEDKDTKVAEDILWREANGIKSIYEYPADDEEE